jgi:hypothetical protein
VNFIPLTKERNDARTNYDQPKLWSNDEEDQTMSSVVLTEAQITILTTLSNEMPDETPCTL